VILVSIDTLRPDHLGAYGYERGTSPILDELALEGLVFENAFSPSPWTLPAHASLFTGLYPEEHGAGHASPFVPLGAGAPTLAERLRADGYRTVAFSAGGVMSRSNGLARGFERWTEWPKANLRSVLPGVFAELGTRADRPVFLFLHTYDVHGPYAEWEEHAAAPTTGPPDPEWERILRIRYHSYLRLDRFLGLADVVDAYDSGIRFVDAELGRLLARLREIGAYDDSLIVVTSDHGESLYDRGLYVGHSYSLHDEEIRVPLIVRLPGGRPPGRVAELVSLVDVMPMILGATGTKTPAGLSGSDPLRRQYSPRDTFVRGEATHTGARYLRTIDRKWITEPHPRGSKASRVPEGLWDRFEWDGRVYDLAQDGTEGQPVDSSGEPAGPVREWIHAGEAPGLGEDSTPIEPQQADQLRALGYLPTEP
jgi:arylsulfatase A-like enzyme